MLRLVTDEHVPVGIVRGIRQYHPEVDVVRVQEVGLIGMPDSHILEWAAQENRIVISQDRRTMIRDANNRVTTGLAMPGVLILKKGPTVGKWSKRSH